ncbi:MAG: quinone oxidoreductase-like protein [Pseudarthrobacter sp.]|nr:quinone oxidoreductase-like protein [Pseudarthrobacter sp.]
MTSHDRSVTEGPCRRASSAVETTLRAIVQEVYGSADVLHSARIARPVIGEKEVLVRVHGAGLDRGTWHVTTGLP